MGSSYSPIPIINRMTEVLNEILGTSSGLTATELMKRLDIPKTTLYRLLASLCDNNFLQYNERNSKYTMGRKFSYVYSRFNEKYNAIKRASHIHLQELANRIGETVQLSVLNGAQAYTLISAEAEKPLKLALSEGAYFPLNACASGKVLLSCLSAQESNHYIDYHLHRYTERTAANEELKQELSKIKEYGYAVENGEFIPSVCSIAVPVEDCEGDVVAALSVFYHDDENTSIDIAEMVGELKKTSSNISHDLELEVVEIPVYGHRI